MEMEFVQVRAKVITDSTGAVSEIPILLTREGPLQSLVDYFLWRRHDRSVAWMRKVVQAAGRVIRTPSDRGSVHLIDDRYARAQVRALLPRWWDVRVT